MAIADVAAAIKGVEPVPELKAGSSISFGIRRTKPYTARILENNTDLATITMVLNPSGTVPQVRVSFFKLVGDRLIPDGSVLSSDVRIQFQKELSGGIPTYIHLETKASRVEGILSLSRANYIPSSNFLVDSWHGCRATASLSVRKPSRHCTEPIIYEIVEGHLPDGLRLLSHGVIVGTIRNLDCMPDNVDYSPSFNWFSDNHDDVTEAWARMWRFRVRMSLANQPHVQSEQWMCIKVYNNWDLDRERLESHPIVVVEESRGEELQAKPQVVDLCPPCIPTQPFIPTHMDTVGLCGQPIIPESGVLVNGNRIPLSQIRYTELGNCEACKDPTRPRDIEEYIIPLGTIIRTPDELLQFYAHNQDNYDPLVMQLHSSTILPDIYENLARDKKHRTSDYEIRITRNKIELIRYHALPGRGMDDIDERMLSIRNRLSQINPILGYGYYGSEVWAELIW